MVVSDSGQTFVDSVPACNLDPEDEIVTHKVTSIVNKSKAYNDTVIVCILYNTTNKQNLSRNFAVSSSPFSINKRLDKPQSHKGTCVTANNYSRIITRACRFLKKKMTDHVLYDIFTFSVRHLIFNLDNTMGSKPLPAGMEANIYFFP